MVMKHDWHYLMWIEIIIIVQWLSKVASTIMITIESDFHHSIAPKTVAIIEW